jgi:hypothetical protein
MVKNACIKRWHCQTQNWDNVPAIPAVIEWSREYPDRPAGLMIVSNSIYTSKSRKEANWFRTPWLRCERICVTFSEQANGEGNCLNEGGQTWEVCLYEVCSAMMAGLLTGVGGWQQAYILKGVPRRIWISTNLRCQRGSIYDEELERQPRVEIKNVYIVVYWPQSNWNDFGTKVWSTSHTLMSFSLLTNQHYIQLLWSLMKLANARNRSLFEW